MSIPRRRPVAVIHGSSQALPRRLSRARGLSLIELMVGIALLALLMGLAMPSFANWLRNAQVRTASDALQNGLRTAQAEALRRHSQVVFFRTAQAVCTNATTASASGSHWAIRTVPLAAGETAQTLQCGVLAEAEGVALDGPAAVCFNGIGRQVANPNPGIGGASCTLPANGTARFDLTQEQADRPLRVLVSLGGSVRLCDPARTRSADAPEGCP